ncbi:MAG: ribokinase, partial [Clostridiales bacterium]|nr:ribokinase [Clostridiales bacterium]
MMKTCVVGSLNMDLVATVDRFPKPGETIIGNDFATYPGGKGGNQAVALG